MTRSIHDNHVLGYEVDAREKSIVIRTEFRDKGEPFERTDVRFEGVVEYLFQDNLDGILFGIEEGSLEDLMASPYRANLESGERSDWPWNEKLEEIRSLGVRVFFIESSFGFDGFVVSRSMVIEAVEST